MPWRGWRSRPPPSDERVERWIDQASQAIVDYCGRDFADRTNDDDLIAAVEALGLDPVEVPPNRPAVEVPADLGGFFRPEDFAAYFRGNLFGAQAIAGRLTVPDARAVALQHRDMAKATVDAWQEWRTRLS